MNSIKEQREALLKQLDASGASPSSDGILQVLCLHEGKRKFETRYEDGDWHTSLHCPECEKECVE